MIEVGVTTESGQVLKKGYLCLMKKPMKMTFENNQVLASTLSGTVYLWKPNAEMRYVAKMADGAVIFSFDIDFLKDCIKANRQLTLSL